MLITSVNNEKIKRLVKLKEKKYRDIENIFFIEGKDLIIEAIKNNVLKELYILEETTLDFKISEDIKPIYITKEIMKKISDMESPSEYYGICQKKEELPIGSKIIILEDIQDPGNLGTIIRSASAFNFDTIVLSKNTVDLYNPKVIRSTKGMLFNTNIIIKDLEPFLSSLQDYIIYGTDVTNGINVKNENPQNKIAIVIGNEGRGISQNIKALCNKFLYINMNQSCESLNASVAASILMYELNQNER